MQERWDVPNAEYVQPKMSDATAQPPPGMLTNGGRDAAASQQSSLPGVRPSEGMNAEELWRPDASAKASTLIGALAVRLAVYAYISLLVDNGSVIAETIIVIISES